MFIFKSIRVRSKDLFFKKLLHDMSFFVSSSIKLVSCSALYIYLIFNRIHATINF